MQLGSPSRGRTIYASDYHNLNTLIRQPAGTAVTMSFNTDLRRVSKEA